MITDACKVAMMGRLEATYHDLGPPPEPGDNSPSLWRELAEVMKCAEDDKQLKLAVETLMRQPGRQFCPKPGDLSGAIAAESTTHEYEPEWTEKWPCEMCLGTGMLSGPNKCFPTVAWCTCEYGLAESRAEPGFCDEYNRNSEELYKRIRAKNSGAGRRKSSGFSRPSQILGKLL